MRDLSTNFTRQHRVSLQQSLGFQFRTRFSILSILYWALSNTEIKSLLSMSRDLFRASDYVVSREASETLLWLIGVDKG